MRFSVTLKLSIIAVVAILSCAKLGPEQQWANPLDHDGSNWYPPTVQAPSDTNVAINDSIMIRASGNDENGTVEKFLWSIDHGKTWSTQSEPDNHTCFLWDSNQVGRHCIWVKAVDNDGVHSTPDSFTTIVHDYRPLLKPVRDTIVSQRAVVTVSTVASDTNGTIVQYYWNVDGSTDSTKSSQHDFSDTAGGPLTIAWGARDDDGFIVRDTFTILFNRGPSKVEMLNPKDKEVTPFLSYNYIDEIGASRLRFQAQDPDGAADSITYMLTIGSKPETADENWSGRTNEYIAPKLLPSATYYWKLRAKDLFGDSIETIGSFSTPSPPSGPRGMVLIRSAGKTFPMGIDSGEAYEKPLHLVAFSYHFWIDTTEVTVAEYGSLVDPTLPSSLVPVAKVNWYDAAFYCNARSKRESRDTVYCYTSVSGTPGKNCTLGGLWLRSSALGYRLPTEAEWEYACRAGSPDFFYWGNDRLQAPDYGWMSDNCDGTAHIVAQKKPNQFRLYDISGNLWEWCNDWFDPEYYKKSPTTSPSGPESADERVIRGGSWSHSDYFMGCGVRSKIMPSFSSDAIGFRAVLQHP